MNVTIAESSTQTSQQPDQPALFELSPEQVEELREPYLAGYAFTD